MKMGTPDSRRLCDFCGESTALLYCKADSAKLCIACDRQVHSTNPLFSKHTRWLLCDSCDSTPATIFCCTHASVFCQNCDWESHTNSSLPSVHDRRALEGFTGCPSVIELLGILGFEDLGKKALFEGCDDADFGGGTEDYWEGQGHDGEYISGLSEFLVWESPPTVVSLDDVVVSKSQAMRVPPLPKNRNATCGQHKEEILCQLRELSKLEPDFDLDVDVEPLIGFDILFPEINQSDAGPDQSAAPKLAPSNEACELHWTSNADTALDFGFSSGLSMNHVVPDKDSDVGEKSGLVNGSHGEQSLQCVPLEPLNTLPRVSIRELNSQERDSAICRYKEKKKTRRYEKRIRYESRKVRAASRTRVKGRFAKMVG